MGGVLVLGESMSQAPLYIVGGTSLFRRGLGSFIEVSPFELVAEFDDADGCVAGGEDGTLTTPEMIVYISTGEPDESSRAVAALRDNYRNARILVLSSELSMEELGFSLRSGANGYLLSDVSKEVLIHSIRLILLGETVFPSQLATAWATGHLRQAENSADPKILGALTPRETEIVGCLTDGASNKVIARQLGITEATVKIHMKSLIRKIGVQNRTQAALWALHSGFAKPSLEIAA